MGIPSENQGPVDNDDEWVWSDSEVNKVRKLSDVFRYVHMVAVPFVYFSDLVEKLFLRRDIISRRVDVNQRVEWKTSGCLSHCQYLILDSNNKRQTRDSRSNPDQGGGVVEETFRVGAAT